MSNKYKYTKGIKEDAELAKESENKVVDILRLVYEEYEDVEIESCHDDKSKWHRGDICFTKGDKSLYIDVKDDGCIWRTGNVACESHKYYKNRPNKRHTGFMEDSKMDIMAVLDEKGGNLYLLHFKKLKEHYKNYRMVDTWLSDAHCYLYLVSLEECEHLGILIKHIKFEDWFNGELSIVDTSKGKLLK